MSAVLRRNPVTVGVLLQNKGIDVNCRDAHTGFTCFWLACYLGEGEIMKQLAERGADIYGCNSDQVNALHLAAYLGDTLVFKMLLESGYDLLKKTADGMTALHIACIEGK